MRKYIRQNEVQQLVKLINSKAHIVQELTPVQYSKDSDDNWIIATAIHGKADFIVTGDKKHLLSLHEIEKIPIITARQLLNKLEDI